MSGRKSDKVEAPELGGGWSTYPREERRAWIALLLLATILRIVNLGDRPFHHDESVHAWFCDKLTREGDYKYDPVYHGPVQYYMVSSTFIAARGLGLLRDIDAKQSGFELSRGDFFARLPAALGGVGLVAMALLLRRRFGPKVALLSGALVACSPIILYYTRFCREDVWSLLGTAGMFLYWDAWLREKRLSLLALASVWCAVAFCSKENFYVLCALMVPSLAAYLYTPGEKIDVWKHLHRFLDFLEKHQVALAGALLLFFVLSEVMYTFFLVHPESGNPAKDAISYWWGQHKVERVSGPKTYYLPRMLQYEFAILFPAFAYLWSRRRQLSAVERFLGVWSISSILMYAYLGEKTPWLIVHQILPFVPLAALAWQRVAASTGILGGNEKQEAAPLRLRILGGAAALASVLSAISLSFLNPNLTPRVEKAESVIYVQTSPEALGVAREIQEAARTGADPVASITGEANWPFNWYVRRLPVSWAMPESNRRPKIAIVDADKADAAAQLLGPGYVKEEIPLRCWWIPENGMTPFRPKPGELLDYLLTRKPWSVVGSQNVAVFRQVANVPFVPAPAPPAAPTAAPGTPTEGQGSPAAPADSSPVTTPVTGTP